MNVVCFDSGSLLEVLRSRPSSAQTAKFVQHLARDGVQENLRALFLPRVKVLMATFGLDNCPAIIQNLQNNCVLHKAVQQQEKEQLMLMLDKRKQSLSPKELQTKYEQRKECAKHLRAMHYYFDTISPAVFASSVTIMDTVLMKVNIPWKYMSCFSAACFFLACKWIEDEFVPLVSDLTSLYYKQWKDVDLRRMEEKILDVLGWQMPRCTYLTFLPEMLKVMSVCHTITNTPISLAYIIRRADMFLLDHFSFKFKPAVLALGTLEHCIGSQNTSYAVMLLQDAVKVLDSELCELKQLLLAGDNPSERAIHGNKAFFPKVFETPCDAFCPDYRLCDIPEERSDSASEVDLLLSVPTHTLDNANDSISDYDYSDDGGDDSETSTVVKDSKPMQHSDIIHVLRTECEHGPACEPVSYKDSKLEEFTCFVQSDSCLVADLQETENYSRRDWVFDVESIKHSSLVQNIESSPCFTSRRDLASVEICTESPSSEETISEHDSGCEQDSDEQDLSSEQDLSEQDSGCDQDSDS